MIPENCQPFLWVVTSQLQVFLHERINPFEFEFQVFLELCLSLVALLGLWSSPSASVGDLFGDQFPQIIKSMGALLANQECLSEAPGRPYEAWGGCMRSPHTSEHLLNVVGRHFWSCMGGPWGFSHVGLELVLSQIRRCWTHPIRRINYTVNQRKGRYVPVIPT